MMRKQSGSKLSKGIPGFPTLVAVSDSKVRLLPVSISGFQFPFFFNLKNFTDKNGNEKDGGVCKKMTNMHSFFKNNPSKSLDKFREDIAFYSERRANWGWGEAEFSGFSKFDDVTQDDFEFGWGCSNVMESKPSKVKIVSFFYSV